ncbi:hypothetical protein, partial [uncultured Duncaniella sp.]|uniref:hypothetical protein n=1 Tax=uncultured Duncaniella sp. TaxID=2768039 RepID=UPI0025B63D98
QQLANYMGDLKCYPLKVGSISLFMDMGFERGCVSRSGFIIPLTTIWFASRFGNSFGAWFDTHN